MIKIGITGSLSSGKSTVAKIFSGNKYPIFDSDKAVRKIYKNSYFKKKISKILKLKKGTNIKNQIKKYLLSNKTYLKKLEKIIHPLVRKQSKSFSKKNKKKSILIFEVPLLIESNLIKDYDRIIFVNSKKKQRLRRYLKKGKTEKLFNILDKRQLSSAVKIKFSDHVINNNSSIKKLKKEVESIKLKYV